jgi:transcriptional regulator with XRE-family HTH domain
MYTIVKNQDELILQIKHYMLDNKLKQKDIVVATGLSKQTISNLLNGRSKNMTLDTLFMLLNALDCNLSISLNKKDNTDNTSKEDQ